MPQPGLTALLAHARRTVGPPARVGTDGELLTAFLSTRDDAAFTELVNRFGPMVFAVCRRGTGHRQDAEDAFQATFVVLARKAASVTPREMVGNWLYGVAVRTAREARAMAAKRFAREVPVAQPPEVGRTDREPDDLAEVLDAELAELPCKFRQLLVLCDMRGEAQTDVAARLGVPVGTLYSRLAKARSLLAERLRKRGVAFSATGLGIALGDAARAAVPTRLLAKTVATALSPDHVPAALAALTNGVLRTMLFKKMTIAGLAALVLATCAFAFAPPDVPVPPATVPGMLMPRPVVVRADSRAPKAAPPAAKTWQRHGDPIEAHALGTSALAFTPDGTRVLTGGPLVKDNGGDLEGEWRTWDPETGKPDLRFDAPKHGFAIHGATFSPDGKRLATVCQDGKIVVWNSATSDVVWDATAHADHQCRAVAFSPDGKWIVTAGTDGKVRRWNATNGKSEFEVTPGEEDKLWSVAVGPDGKMVVAAGQGGTVYFLDSKTGKVTAKHEKHSGAVLALAFTRDGKTVISNSQDKDVKVWDAATGTTRHTLSNDYGSDCAMAVSADGTRLAVTGKNGAMVGVRIYDLGTGKEVTLLESKLKWVVKLAFRPDGKTLAVAGTLTPDGNDTSAGGLEFWTLK